MTTKTDILKSLADRKSRRWGIRKAADYVSSFVGCFGDGECPTSLLSVSAKQWAKALKEAESSLVYSHPSMRIKDAFGSDLPAGAILGFECVITTTRKDRDGDVLESSGASLDPDMPLLWQHLPLQPIGKFVRESTRSKSFVKGVFAIADTELGRDAKTLVEFKSLRISHGFQPTEFEPIFDEKDRHEGWHIRKYEVLETSLVSVPANSGAIITDVFAKSFSEELDGIRTAYGRSLLKTDAVKAWAKHFYDNRPVQGNGCACGTKNTAVANSADATVTVKLDATDLIKALETHGKIAEPKTEKMYGEFHIPGSFESVQCQLQRTLKRHLLKSSLEVCESWWCWLEATFPDHAIVCLEGDHHYRLSYSVVDGMAAWDGEPTKVEIDVSAAVMDVDKQRASLWEKGITPVGDGKPAANIERQHLANLVKNPSQLREFRDRLNVLVEAQQPPGVADGVLEDLLG